MSSAKWRPFYLDLNVLILFYFCTQFLIYWNDKKKLKVIIDQFVFTY